MSDFVNKIVSIVLIFLMLVISPLLISYMTNDMTARRAILNDVTMFIDKVTDKGAITEDDIDQLYLDVNSHGMIIDAKVKRLIRVASKTPDGLTKTVYFATDPKTVDSPDYEGNMYDFNPGDVVQVTVSEIGSSTVRRLTYAILKIDNGKFEMTLSGSVR